MNRLVIPISVVDLEIAAIRVRVVSIRTAIATVSPADRIDHVFVRGFEVHAAGVVPDTDASDHLPQWVVLGWPPRTDAEDAQRSTEPEGPKPPHQR